MAGRAKTKANSKIRIADNGYKFPEQLPIGEKLIDSLKNEWLLGKAIARGGFGEIYEAKPSLIKSNLTIKKCKDYEYVVKVDHLQGPLFCEMNFYIRAAKREIISKWMSDKGIKFLGIPSFIAAGTHTRVEPQKTGKKTKDATRYRFLVMPRFGYDLQKVLDANKLKLPLKTAYTIGIKILDILEFIHSQGYIHADIKASNLLLALDECNAGQDSLHKEVWLVDFGLVEKYMQGDNGNHAHKPYEEDLRKANNGTIEFTSRDGHIGCFSRKGDIEILAYNLLSWLSGGQLPWMHNLLDKTLVKNLKNNYMSRLDDLLSYAFQNTKCETITSATSNKRVKASTGLSTKANVPQGITEFFKLVIKMRFDEKPDYKLFKSILEKAIASEGSRFDGMFYLRDCANRKISSISTTLTDGTHASHLDIIGRNSPLLKRKISSNKSVNSESTLPTNYSDVTVIFDDTDNDDNDSMDEIDDEEDTLPAKKPRKVVSNGYRKSPVVLNAKIASNGRTKNGHANGKSTQVAATESNGKLLNENYINKLNNELVVNNGDQVNGDDDVDNKRRRRNPSRKVKHCHQPNLNENHKVVVDVSTISNQQTVKNGHMKNSLTENEVVFQGKVVKNPTPAMIELMNRVNNKAK